MRSPAFHSRQARSGHHLFSWRLVGAGRLQMFTRLFASLLLSGVAVGTCAQSTSAFTPVLFGVIDVNLRSVKNGSAKTLRSESTDGLTSSRIGFRGQEDLGDGQKVGFWLEAPLSADTGTSNSARFWNRRSTVSLIDPAFGELRAGRDNTPAFNAYNVYDPFGTNGLGEILGNGTTIGILSALGSGANTLSRSDNQLSYFTPSTLGGAYAQVSAAPREGASGNRLLAARVGFARKPFDVSIVYTETTVVAGDKLKQAMVGAFYDFDVVKLSGEAVQIKYRSAAGGSRKQTIYQAGAFIPLGRHILRADLIHGDMSGGTAGSGFADSDDANQYAIGYEYQLSKRTSLYSVASTLRNRGASRLVVAAGNPGMTAGEKSTGFDLGLRHSF